MKKKMLGIIVLLAVPLVGYAEEPFMKFVAVKHVENDHMFLYRCYGSDNVIELEQRYNPYAKAEQIRFVVNGIADEWVTEGLSPEIFNHLAQGACERSTTRFLTVLKP